MSGTDRKELTMGMKEGIKEALVDAASEIFHKRQIELHIVSGDIDPWSQISLDNTLDKAADQMVEILNKQPKLGVVKLEMLDGQIVDLSNADISNDIVIKLADIEKYLREKELI